MNIFLKALGGIPVDRGKKNSLTEQMAQEFSKRDYFQLAITPEGTRKKNAEWKRGFYYIALSAKIPVVIVVFDYGRKTVTYKTVFYPTGNIEEDMLKIKSYYAGAAGKNPENFVM